jgi:bla regulator protein blaR1
VNVVDPLAGIASRLIETSLVGGLLALLVWALCRLVPALPPAVRCWLWWGVALKMLLGLLPLPALSLPLLPALPSNDAIVARLAPQSPVVASVPTPRSAVAPSPSSGPRGGAARSPSFPPPSVLSALPWRTLLAALWLAGVAVGIARAAADLLRARRVVRAAEPVHAAALVAVFDDLRCSLDAPAAELRISRAVATPQVVGVRRPVVLLPAGTCERLDGDELAMALGHELLHVRRDDLLLGWVPALAARCFFFHPLARLVEREHALAREAACDAAVVARLAPSPRAYGRLLLELALGCGTPLRAAAPAVTHPTLQRRLQMLLRPARPFRPVLAAPLLLLGFGALLPLRVTAREEAVTATSATEPTVAAVAAHGSRPTEAVAATPAVEPATPAAPTEPATATRATLAMAASPAEPARVRSDRDDDEAWILFLDHKRRMANGSTGDIEIGRRHQRGDEPLFWVRRGSEEWVVRDPAFLARIDGLFDSVRELGARQAELGSKQAELGSHQAELGAQQAELGSQMAVLGSQQAALGAQMGQLNAQHAALVARQYRADEAEQAAIERQTRELERQVEQLGNRQSELGRQQSDLGRRQGELGERQGELGGKQGELGERQSELGRQQSEASEEAQRALAKLVDEAIRSGLATRVE